MPEHLIFDYLASLRVAAAARPCRPGSAALIGPQVAASAPPQPPTGPYQPGQRPPVPVSGPGPPVTSRASRPTRATTAARRSLPTGPVAGVPAGRADTRPSPAATGGPSAPAAT